MARRELGAARSLLRQWRRRRRIMSRTLTFELSDEAYARLQRLAEAIGTSPSDLAAVSLERQFGAGAPSRTEAEKQAAREIRTAFRRGRPRPSDRGGQREHRRGPRRGVRRRPRGVLMFLDTSGLLCLHHQSEPFHDRGRSDSNAADPHAARGWLEILSRGERGASAPCPPPGLSRWGQGADAPRSPCGDLLREPLSDGGWLTSLSLDPGRPSSPRSGRPPRRPRRRRRRP